MTSYLLMFWYLLPAFLLVLFGATSYSLPLLFISLFLFFFIIASSKKTYFPKQAKFIFILILISAPFSFLFAGQPILPKQFFSWVALLICSIAIYSTLKILFSLDELLVVNTLLKVYFVFLLIGATSILFPATSFGYFQFAKPVIPFPEPSHFALGFVQISAFVLPLLNKNQRLFVASAPFLLGLLFPNLTLLVSSFCLVCLLLRIRTLMFILLVFVFVAYLLANSELPIVLYILSRLSGDDGQNLSSLVYLQGWQSIYSALSSTNLIGLGFQNLGNEPLTEAGAMILEINNDSALNRLDGGFMLPKIIGEFGLIGILFVTFYFFNVVRSFLLIRNIMATTSLTLHASMLIPVLALYSSIVEVFVRGVGYFSPSFIITLVLVPSAYSTLNRSAYLESLKITFFKTAKSYK
jgi:hypothetical protein